MTGAGAAWRIVGFLAAYLVLEAGVLLMRGTRAEGTLVNELTVRPAAWLIRMFTPEVALTVQGHKLLAPGGGISVNSGCDGLDTMVLFIAAFVSTWRDRRNALATLAAALAGVALLHSLNLLRIAVLFYAFRNSADWFSVLHGSIAPLVLVAAGCAYFYWWSGRAPRAAPS
jgi:exosortase/archaeosortase family protein